MIIMSGFELILEFGDREESFVLGRSWRKASDWNLVGLVLLRLLKVS